MQRYFQRVNRRAGLKVVYSEGFSPHQKMSFAMPLSVGYESDSEYFDIEVTEAKSSVSVMELLNKEKAEGIDVIDCVRLPDRSENAMASVRAADYIVSFREGFEPPFDMAAAVSALKDADEFIIKKPVKSSKRRARVKQSQHDEPGYKEVDLRPLIYEISADPGSSKIYMKVSAGSIDNVRPDTVISALYERAGFELQKISLMVTRRELYTLDTSGQVLIPLSDMGERF